MKKLTKVLAALMLMGFGFSTNVFAMTHQEFLDNYYDPSEHGVLLLDPDIFLASFIKDPGKFMDLKAKKAVKKVEKKTITMAEIRAYKFDESLNDVVTETESLIAKTLIEKYDLWNVYRVAGGAGIRAKMKDLGLGGHSKTNYRPHAGNIFVYMSNNFSAQEIKEKLRIKFKDFAEMSIDPDDFMEGKVSSRTLAMAYGTMLKNRRVASGTSVEVILASL